MKNKLIVIAGPTAVGKTDLCIKLAQKFNTHIISADSRQFFKEMKIGTAPPTASELEAAPHHFIGNLSIHDPYDVFDYQRDANNEITELFSQNLNPLILTGGSGLYINAVTQGFDDLPDTEPIIRDQLWATFESEGLDPLRLQLKMLDPNHYNKVDIANPKRVIRALEVCLTTGKPYSSLLNTKIVEHNFDIISICLNRDREELYNRINQRVDIMIENGLLEEARNLYPHRHLNALKTVGYKELFEHFDGNLSLEEAIDKIKINTRRFAKRQITWFKRDPNTKWVHPENIDEIIEYIETGL